MRLTGRILAVLLGSGLLLVSGCGDPKGRQAVSGTVTFKGQPLDQGQIDFLPAGAEGTQSGATIADGKYSIPRDKGLVPGTYTVKIWSYDERGSKVAGEVPGEPSMKQYKERIAAKYNVNSTLRAEVKKDGSNHFDFPVD